MRTYRHRLAGDEVVIYAYEPGDDLTPFHDFIARQAAVGFDTESSGVDIFEPGWFTRLAQFGNGTEAHVLRFDCHRLAIESAVYEARALIMHNGQHDLHVLAEAYGIPLWQTMPKTLDTLMISRLFDPMGYTVRGQKGKIVPTHKLKDRIRMLHDGGFDMDKELKERFRKLKLKIADGYRLVPIDDEIYVRYAGLDPILAWRLYDILCVLSTAARRELLAYEQRIAYALATMTGRGLLVDQDYTRQQSGRLLTEAEASHARARKRGWPVDGIETKADKAELAGWLKSRGVKLAKTDSGNDSLAKTTLEAAVAGTPYESATRDFFTARELRKFERDYLQKFLSSSQRDGRVHPTIDALGAQTGRNSISNPPLQQLPRIGDVRGCLAADPGYVLIAADYAQIEFRVAAALAEEANMIKVIRAGIDMHAVTATRLYGKHFDDEQRNVAKRAGFGRIYGAGKATVALQTGVDEETAARALAAFDKSFPGIRAYARRLSQQTEVVTPFGRTIPVDTQRPWGAINYAVQSTARDVFMCGMLRLIAAGFGDFLWLPVHDELIACVPESITREAVACMTSTMADDFDGVPIVADGGLMGPRWRKGTIALAA